jgi:demethylmenaquinone methyltransferase/2-methoxy-6-polyprenyl-1,4-benzoquinol methylase
MTGGEPDSAPGPLLGEQIAFYRANAQAYEAWAREVFERGGGGAFGAASRRERARVLEALRRFGARGRVLELAAGTGRWTRVLLETAEHVTAVDAAPEALALARARLTRDAGRVRLVEADLFGWRPPGHFDAVFFAYWLSHVPPGRFEAFWRMVGDALAPGGRVFLVDSTGPRPAGAGRPGTDVYREEDDLDRAVSVRELAGRRYRVVKVAWEPAALEARLAALGWRASLRAGALAYWGSAQRGS